MIKHVFVGWLQRVNPVEADRWYFRFHSKEVVRAVAPWLRRYETYRAYEPPPEAERFGVRDGRLTELWYDNVAAFNEADTVNRPYSPAPFQFTRESPMVAAVTIVPAMPTEDFLGKEPTPEERTILRWYCVFRYPEGVSVEEGEKWYLEVNSQEVREQPGLLRYASHRVLDPAPIDTPWHRVSELWYDDFDAWRRANIDSPPKYTGPPWGGEEPFVDMRSVFVGYKPDVDFLKDNPVIP